jgi:hypothetical protein
MGGGDSMKQVLYTSLSTVKGYKADLGGILEQSRHNNAIDGVTGLLWADGRHFIQVLEGPDASVGATALRIWADTRHHDIRILHEITIEKQEFGGWTMAHCRAGDAPTVHDTLMRRLLDRASHEVSQAFYGLISAERGASFGPATSKNSMPTVT